MKIFKCSECGDGCVMSELDGSGDPDNCIYNETDRPVKWQETEEYQIIKIKRADFDVYLKQANDRAKNESADKFKTKEPEMMTLQEAFEKAKKGQRIEHPTEASFIKNDTPPPFDLSYKSAIEKKWQIIPAEPNVLSAEDYIMSKSFPYSEYNDIREAFKSGDKNGQLKQWINHKELRGAAEQFEKRYPASNDPLFKNALKNLKPFKPE